MRLADNQSGSARKWRHCMALSGRDQDKRHPAAAMHRGPTFRTIQLQEAMFSTTSGHKQSIGNNPNLIWEFMPN
jgi:hypothetical protein